MPSTLSTVVLLASFVSSALSIPTTGWEKADPKDIIYRDVAVIGGGSSGINAAISLKDAGKSIMVIESQNRLGGHTETYRDPATGITAEAGVAIFHNEPEVHRYFGRFGIQLVNQSIAGLINAQPFDYRTGQALPAAAAQPPSPQAVGLAYQKLAGFLAKYPELDRGMFVKTPVDPVLLQPFGTLVKQMGIEALVPSAYSLSQNIGDFTNTPVLEVVRLLGLSLIKTIASQGFLTTAKHDNSELYVKATAELQHANSVWLSSQVIHTNRKADSVQLIVQTPQGTKYLCVKKVLMSIPPRVELLKAFDLRQKEKDIFNKFINVGYYTSLVNNTGFPLGFSPINVSPDQPFGVAQLPSGFVFRPTAIKGLQSAYFGTPASRSTFAYSDDWVKSQIIATFKRLQAANPKTLNQTDPTFAFFKHHNPYSVQARAEDIKAGIYTQLYALQGLDNVFWTGAAWRCHDSSLLWRFNQEVVLPALLKSL